MWFELLLLILFHIPNGREVDPSQASITSPRAPGNNWNGIQLQKMNCATYLDKNPLSY
ncbi:unnamed protein product [Cylicocyclus nassatus]|uniref:Uncharacterized protein n=1 Tax=Cylicocyclus nassatus TaxID=53992 RepID=A0AA36GCC4_CYLNA|nr:unnamed protein product [Cylicocyclus nassatus]